MRGGNGGDTLYGRAGNDRLDGCAGDDRLTGGDGNDNVFGGKGNDTFVATKSDGQDRYDGGPGSDTLDLSGTTAAVNVSLEKGYARSSDIGFDRLSSIENVIGSAGDDAIVGDQSGNHLDGGPGDDVIGGRGGSDTLLGATGNDTLDGGAGPDTFVFAKNFGHDRIVGFAPGADRIEFHALFADFAALMAATVDDGSGNVVITYDAASSIVLEHVAKANIHAADFSFT